MTATATTSLTEQLRLAALAQEAACAAYAHALQAGDERAIVNAAHEMERADWAYTSAHQDWAASSEATA